MHLSVFQPVRDGGEVEAVFALRLVGRADAAVGAAQYFTNRRLALSIRGEGGKVLSDAIRAVGIDVDIDGPVGVVPIARPAIDRGATGLAQIAAGVGCLTLASRHIQTHVIDSHAFIGDAVITRQNKGDPHLTLSQPAGKIECAPVETIAICAVAPITPIPGSVEIIPIGGATDKHEIIIGLGASPHVKDQAGGGGPAQVERPIDCPRAGVVWVIAGTGQGAAPGPAAHRPAGVAAIVWVAIAFAPQVFASIAGAHIREFPAGRRPGAFEILGHDRCHRLQGNLCASSARQSFRCILDYSRLIRIERG